MCVRVLRFEFFSNGALPKPLPDHLQTLFLAVRQRNKLPVPSFEFIRRTVAFQKYNLLTGLLFGDEGQKTREFVHTHRNMYTEVERHMPFKSAEGEGQMAAMGNDDTRTQNFAPISEVPDYDIDPCPHDYDQDGNGTSPPPAPPIPSDEEGIVLVAGNDISGPDVNEGGVWIDSGIVEVD